MKNGDIMTNFYLFSMANLWRKWKSYSEISFHNDYHFFFSLKSTQQKFKELLSQHCQLHCRKKNAAKLSWWWLSQTIIIPCIKPGTIGDNFTPGRTLSYVGWRTSLWFLAGCCFIQIRYLRLSPTNLKTFLPFFSQQNTGYCKKFFLWPIGSELPANSYRKLNQNLIFGIFFVAFVD